MGGGRVRIGFVGVGAMGQCAHLRNYCSIAGCEVVALAEIREKTGAAVARRYDIAAVYTCFEQMLEQEQLDALVASQPYDRHAILLPQLAQAGKPIFIEKPLSNGVASGERIRQCLEEAGTWVMVGYHKRSDPACRYAKEEVEGLKTSGELGALRYVRVLMPAGDWIAGGFWDLIDQEDIAGDLERETPPDDLGEEAFRAFDRFVNYYIHQVNLLRFFLGEPYRVTYADPSGVLLVGESSSGVPCTIEMSPYVTTRDWQESVLIAFERGYVKVELPAPLAFNRPGRVEVLRDPGAGTTPTVVRPQLPWVHAMRQQAIHFVAAVKGEREPACGAGEALEDLRVARQYLRLWKGC